MSKNGCRLYVRDKVIFRSQVKENNHHPRWNEDFKFLVHEPQYQVWPAVFVLSAPLMCK